MAAGSGSVAAGGVSADASWGLVLAAAFLRVVFLDVFLRVVFLRVVLGLSAVLLATGLSELSGLWSAGFTVSAVGSGADLLVSFTAFAGLLSIVGSMAAAGGAALSVVPDVSGDLLAGFSAEVSLVSGFLVS